MMTRCSLTTAQLMMRLMPGYFEINEVDDFVMSVINCTVISGVPIPFTNQRRETAHHTYNA